MTTDREADRPAEHAADRAADLVLTNGRIATMDRARTWASTVTVRDGRIVAVGSDEAARAFVGPRTRVVDLRGRTVTPGFGDAHVHPVGAGVGQLRCDLQGAHGQDRYLEIVAAYATSHPDEPWIRGDGWSMADFPGGIPRREDLDRVSPESAPPGNTIGDLGRGPRSGTSVRDRRGRRGRRGRRCRGRSGLPGPTSAR